jgi:hypothetical protein
MQQVHNKLVHNDHRSLDIDGDNFWIHVLTVMNVATDSSDERLQATLVRILELLTLRGTCSLLYEDQQPWSRKPFWGVERLQDLLDEARGAKGAKDANITPMLAAAAMGPPVQSFTAMLASAGVQMQAPDADAVPQLWQQVQVASAATAAAGSISIQEAQPLPILPLDISSGGIGLDLSQLMKEPLPSQLLDASPRELFNEQSLQELLQHLQTPQKGKKGAGSRPSSAGMQLAAALKQLKSPDKQLDEAMMAALMRDGEGSMKVSPLVRLRR